MQKSLRGHDRSYWSACFLQIILYQIIILHKQLACFPQWIPNTRVNMALQTLAFAQRHKQKTCMKNTNSQRLNEFYGSFHYVWSLETSVCTHWWLQSNITLISRSVNHWRQTSRLQLKVSQHVPCYWREKGTISERKTKSTAVNRIGDMLGC